MNSETVEEILLVGKPLSLAVPSSPPTVILIEAVYSASVVYIGLDSRYVNVTY